MQKIFSLGAVLFCCYGCNKPAIDVVGIYRMEPLETTPRGKTDPGWDGMALGIMGQTSLEIKADGSFRYEIHIEMYPKETPTSTVGTWKQSGSYLTLTPDQKSEGILSLEPLELKVTKVGRELLPTVETRPGRGFRYYRSDTEPTRLTSGEK